MDIITDKKNDEITYDEIIIGCGIAGLYWCYKTKPSNFLILEKSDRIGGRVFNIDWNGFQISLGGGIIKSTNDLTIKLSNELNLELGNSKSKYHMIDLETRTENINKPNEDNFYESNKIIIKYLKKTFEKNKDQIKKNKLTWNEFLDLYLDLKTSTTIKLNLLYKSYSCADIESVFEHEIDELLRTGDFNILFIKQFGYTGLLNKLVDIVNKTNILTNNEITHIIKEDNLFKIITKQNQIFMAKKIILATEAKSNINFELGESTNNKLNSLYKMSSGSNYIRVYSYHCNSHGLECSYRTNGLVGKVIVINPNVLMCCYTEESQAVELNNLLSKNSKQEQIEIIYKLLKNSSIPIKTKPDDIICKFWSSGIHYNTIDYDEENKINLQKKLRDSNVIVIGESVSNSHGWVNSALESVDFICSL
jgi:hypothetical protein